MRALHSLRTAWSDSQLLANPCHVPSCALELHDVAGMVYLVLVNYEGLRHGRDNGSSHPMSRETSRRDVWTNIVQKFKALCSLWAV